MRGIVKAEPVPGVRLSRDLSEPEPESGEVVVEVAATSVCGTDLELYEWSESAQGFDPKLPFVMGHECSGTVVAVGPEVGDVSVGDRVAAESHIFCGRCYLCRTGKAHNCERLRVLGITWDGAFAEFVKLPDSVCFRLPESVSPEIGALFEPAGVSVHALQRAGSVAGCDVLVNGCGPIGLVVVQLAMLFGASRVFAVEPNALRRELAASLGAITVDPNEQSMDEVLQHVDGGHGVEVAFETSGAPMALPWLLDAVDRESRIVTVGHPGHPVPLDVAAYINKKGVVLAGVFGRRIWDTWETLSQLVVSGRLDLSWLITHRVDLAEFEKGMQLLRRGESGKIIVYPN